MSTCSSIVIWIPVNVELRKIRKAPPDCFGTFCILPFNISRLLIRYALSNSSLLPWLSFGLKPKSIFLPSFSGNVTWALGCSCCLCPCCYDSQKCTIDVEIKFYSRDDYGFLSQHAIGLEVRPWPGSRSFITTNSDTFQSFREIEHDDRTTPNTTSATSGWPHVMESFGSPTQ